jgi:TonB family protein
VFTRRTLLRHRIFPMKLKRTAIEVALISTLIMVGIFWAQTTVAPVGDLRLQHFTSPEYPRLARQAMQSGDVTVNVTVDPSGTVSDLSAKSPYPLLEGPTKEAVRKWRFEPSSGGRKGTIFFHFGFSATVRDCNPTTSVAIDLRIPRFILTVDPRPEFEGDGELSKSKREP